MFLEFCDMTSYLEVYYVHGYCRSCDVRGGGCTWYSSVQFGCGWLFRGFYGLCRGLNFVVFGERSPFCGVLRVKICESVDVDQAVFVSVLVDGVENLE